MTLYNDQVGILSQGTLLILTALTQMQLTGVLYDYNHCTHNSLTKILPLLYV